MLKLHLAGPMSVLALAALSTPVAAQRVSADVYIARGPVAADVRFGSTYVPPIHQVVVTRYVDVDAGRGRGRGHRWERPDDFRRIVVYVDRDGRYYDRWDDRLIGLRAVVVYQRAGRYYWDDGRFRDDDRRDRRDHDERWRH